MHLNAFHAGMPACDAGSGIQRPWSHLDLVWILDPSPVTYPLTRTPDPGLTSAGSRSTIGCRRVSQVPPLLHPEASIVAAHPRAVGPGATPTRCMIPPSLALYLRAPPPESRVSSSHRITGLRINTIRYIPIKYKTMTIFIARDIMTQSSPPEKLTKMFKLRFKTTFY